MQPVPVPSLYILHYDPKLKMKAPWWRPSSLLESRIFLGGAIYPVGGLYAALFFYGEGRGGKSGNTVVG